MRIQRNELKEKLKFYSLEINTLKEKIKPKEKISRGQFLKDFEDETNKVKEEAHKWFKSHQFFKSKLIKLDDHFKELVDEEKLEKKTNKALILN